MTDTPSQEELDAWPNCPIPDCQYKICMWAGESLCTPHTIDKIGSLEWQRRYRDTHIDRKWTGKVATKP